MKSFAYHRPETVPQAVALLASDTAKPLAGGMTLLPTMKLRLAAPGAMIDLSAIPGLSGIAVSAMHLTIGAMTTHDTVARSADVAKAIPALAKLAGGIGDPAVRNRGTIGGSLANNDPTADYPAAVLALGATIVTDKREIAADDFFKGLFETALGTGEIITAVRFPLPQAAGYAKMPNPASRFAIVGVFVAKFATGVRVGVTGAGPCVFRPSAIEAALTKNFAPAAIEKIVIDAAPLQSDIHADAEYRAHLTTVMAQRAVVAAS
jgi:carbon-monoxide dehydrogenase medium subunit